MGTMALRPAPRETQLTEIGDAILMYLVENPEQLADFMTITGMSGSDVQRRAGTAEFAGGLLDYAVQNEPLMLGVCERAGWRPETIMRAWARRNAHE